MKPDSLQGPAVIPQRAVTLGGYPETKVAVTDHAGKDLKPKCTDSAHWVELRQNPTPTIYVSLKWQDYSCQSSKATPLLKRSKQLRPSRTFPISQKQSQKLPLAGDMTVLYFRCIKLNISKLLKFFSSKTSQLTTTE